MDNEKSFKQILSQQNIKVESEAETRKRLLKVAKFLGCLNEMKAIFDKYDKLLSRCTNKQEREAIATMGSIEINDLLGKKDKFSLNGKDIL